MNVIVTNRRTVGVFDSVDDELGAMLAQLDPATTTTSTTATDADRFDDDEQPCTLMDYHERRYRAVLPTSTISLISPIWIEIDHVGATRVRLSGVRVSSNDLKNVISPGISGSMRITVSGIQWTPHALGKHGDDIADDDDADSDDDESNAGRLARLRRQLAARRQTPQLYLRWTSMTAIVHGHVVGGNTGPVHSGPSQFYLSFLNGRTGRAVKLFPFSKREMASLIACLHDCSGLDPIDDHTHLDQLLIDKLDQRRRQSMGISTNLITHTRQLVHTIDAITRSTGSVHHTDIQRLAQSCRCARPVLLETLVVLRKRWIVTSSGAVKLKILAALESLLEPTVVSGTDPAIQKLSVWLAQIDRDMDSSKNPLLLRHLTAVRKQIDELMAIRLQSMTKSQDKNVFEAATWPGAPF